MHEEIEYAEMLEIPVSTVNVVRKQRRRKKSEQTNANAELKESVIATVNDRLEESDSSSPSPEGTSEEGSIDFSEIPERIDTVRLYSTNGEGDSLHAYEYTLNEEGARKAKEETPKKIRVALGVELGVACALCAGIFLTNVFMPGSAINTFFRSMTEPQQKEVVRPYTDFDLTPVVSELSDAKLTLSPEGVLSFTDECCVYPAADGKVAEVTKSAEGLYTLKISYSDSFSGVITGLDTVYYAVGEKVLANVPVGYTKGSEEVQVTMYSSGELLNCFELTEENCLAWISTAE